MGGDVMTISELFNNKVMYIDDDFVIFNQNNEKVYDNRQNISADLANHTGKEITRIRLDAQYGLIIKVR
jgi:hypothetical protein